MCDFTKGIKLCSCDSKTIKFRQQEYYRERRGTLVKIENPKNKNIPLIYIWRLFRLIDEDHYSGEIGRYMLPTENIGNGLDAEWIVLNLNLENCFDFEYTPNEGDCLRIQQNVILSPYISFLFKNNQWVIDHHSPFSTTVEHLGDGPLKSPED